MTKQQEFRKQTEEAKFEAFALMCKKVTKLEKENTLLGKRCNQLLKDKGKLTDKCKKLEEQNNKMKRCVICKHHSSISGCSYHSNWVKDCKENGMKLFELKEMKEND
jgi:hypothetical protein